jgi:hypothetical protein
MPNGRTIHRPIGPENIPTSQKVTQTGIFGLKICHLATLVGSRTEV